MEKLLENYELLIESLTLSIVEVGDPVRVSGFVGQLGSGSVDFEPLKAIDWLCGLWQSTTGRCFL